MTPITVEDLARVSVEDFARILAGPPEVAAHWVRAAAAHGDPDAQAIFGQMLLDGRGVARDPLFALHWFERAALAGHRMGMNMVGRCHEHGWGSVRSAAIAAQWYRAAAARGLDWAMYNLATLLALGEGVPEDRVEALAWYRRAAALGHAKSINLIGGFYEEGWVVDRDLAIAREHYRVAAEGGDFRAQYNYARFLIAEGWIDVALFWLRRVPETATPDFLGNLAAFLIDSPHHTLQAFGHELVTRGHAAVRADAAEPVTAAADADPARGATLFPDAGGRSPLARLRRLFARPSPASVADARIFERTAT